MQIQPKWFFAANGQCSISGGVRWHLLQKCYEADAGTNLAERASPAIDATQC